MARGGYTPKEISEMSNEEIFYINHYQEIVSKQQQEFISSCLGVVWDSSHFTEKEPEKQPKQQTGMTKSNDKIFIPLSVAINPQIMEFIKKQFKNIPGGKISQPYIGGGEYIPKAGEVIMSMDQMGKDEFKKMVGSK